MTTASDLTGKSTVSWQAAPSVEFEWAELDDGCVLFHCRSGQTHFLNAASVTLLQQILIEATDLEGACRSFTILRAGGVDDTINDREPTPEFRKHLRTILDRFEELGLVRRIES